MMRTGVIALTFIGMTTSLFGAVSPYEEDFSAATGIEGWTKCQETPDTTIKWNRDGYMIVNIQDGIQENEAVGRTLDGTLRSGETIEVSARFVNIHNSYYKGSIQLWDSVNNVLLSESEPFTVYGAKDPRYEPVKVQMICTVPSCSAAVTVQVRFAEKCNSAQRDMAVDSMSVKPAETKAGIPSAGDKPVISEPAPLAGTPVSFTTSNGEPLRFNPAIYELGPAMPSLNVHSSDFGKLPDGTPGAFAVGNGDPLTFNVLDLRNGKRIHSVEVPGESMAGFVHQSSDGSVYFTVSQVTPGVLFRYIPEKKELLRIGERIKGEVWLRDVVSDADGRIYTATYPNAKLLSYDPRTGETRDYGSVVKDAAYGYTGVLVDDEVWIGTGTVPHIIAVKRNTGAMREIAIPEMFIKNVQYISKLSKRGNYVFAKFSPAGITDAAMYNLHTKEWKQAPAGIADSTEPDDTGTVYFLYNRQLHSYNLETGKAEETGMAKTPARRGLSGKQRTYDIGLVNIDGKKAVVGMTTEGNLWRYFPETGAGDTLKAEVQESAAKIVGFSTGPDGRIYAGAKFGSGMIGRIDPATHKIERITGPVQAEGVGGKGNTILIGEYTGAGLNVGDLSKPWSWGSNPRKVFNLGRGGPYYQDRIWTIEPAGDRFALGTIPEPGQNGGALTFFDPVTGKYEVHRDVVKKQSVIDLTSRDGLLYGATAVHGGSGTEEEAKEACLFIWDLAAGKKIWEGVPVPGSPVISSLTWTPDGLLWGISETGEVFEFDPQNRKVLRIKSVCSSANTHPWGNHSSLVYNEQTDAFLGTVGGRVFCLNRKDLDSQVLSHKPEIWRLVRAGNGNVYGVGETQVYFIELRPK